jgi:hypothetical protein
MQAATDGGNLHASCYGLATGRWQPDVLAVTSAMVTFLQYTPSILDDGAHRRTGENPMSNVSSNWNAIMQYSFIRIFANDGTIDADELAMLERLAMADGLVDDRERKVLASIFSRINMDTVPTGVLEDIEKFKALHQIP